MDSYYLNTKLKKLRVLMIGPGEGVGGGIAALVDTLLPVLEKQVSLWYLPSVKRRQLKDSGKLSFRNLAIAFSQYARFLVALIRFRPNIIHLHTSQGIAWLKDSVYVIIGKLFHARVILHMHGGNFDTIYYKNPRIIQSYTRLILGLADAILSVSTEWKIRLAKLIPVDRVFSLKNCIDTQALQQRGAFDVDQAVNVLFIGRIGPQKGAFDLIEAIHCLQPAGFNFHVWMVGPEERNGDFQIALHLLEKYQLANVCELLGSIQHEKVFQLLREASLFVLPSYYEGLPMAILEALAASLPVIATSVGGIPEVIHDTYNGFLIPSGNIEALAGALEKLVCDPTLRMMMGQRSREIAERELDVSTYIEKITTLYSSLDNLTLEFGKKEGQKIAS
jgi:glycosyltransferase involved in cell wall biosynthesis